MTLGLLLLSSSCSVRVRSVHDADFHEMQRGILLDLFVLSLLPPSTPLPMLL